MTHYFDTESFVEEISQSPEIADSHYQVIERLCKKVDVVKSIYQRYSSDVASKMSDQEVSHTTYCNFFECLVRATKIKSDLKFLNSAIKLNNQMKQKLIISPEKHRSNQAELDVLLDKLVSNKREDNV